MNEQLKLNLCKLIDRLERTTIAIWTAKYPSSFYNKHQVENEKAKTELQEFIDGL